MYAASSTAEFLERKTVVELRAIAKERGIVGYSRMRKEELVLAIDHDIADVIEYQPVRSN